ncbi:SymE family type I addiction module toxin [Pantoea agglomerans]
MTAQCSIAGRWLAVTGLKTGQAVIVRGEAGCLTLTTGG